MRCNCQTGNKKEAQHPPGICPAGSAGKAYWAGSLRAPSVCCSRSGFGKVAGMPSLLATSSRLSRSRATRRFSFVVDPGNCCWPVTGDKVTVRVTARSGDTDTVTVTVRETFRETFRKTVRVMVRRTIRVLVRVMVGWRSGDTETITVRWHCDIYADRWEMVRETLRITVKVTIRVAVRVAVRVVRMIVWVNYYPC